MNRFIKLNQNGLKNLTATILIVYIYVLMEWFFFVTKPSFMSNLNSTQKIMALLSTGAILSVPVSAVSLFVYWIGKLLHKPFTQIHLSWFRSAIPALIAASLELILIDNFTYTVFGIGIVSTSGIWRLLYTILFVGLFTLSNIYLNKNIYQSQPSSQPLVYFVIPIWIISILIVMLQNPDRQTRNHSEVFQSASQLPNIILLGIDGVNAENMSVYGYTRDTTPNIQTLAETALIVENAFANSANTGGSLTALLTGKLPTETRVVYPPDILIGDDAYQHLPGILKQIGYQTVQITMPSFGDAYERNIKRGFDVANFRSEASIPLMSTFEKLGAGNGVYFSALIIQRIRERLEHAFFIKKMDNPFEIVTQPTAQITEEQRFDGMLSYLENTSRPIFLHVHMLVTHGPKFEPRKNVFSKGQEQNESWMTDFYDDAILDFDEYFNTLFTHLNKTGKINNTLVILYSDHGMNWDALERVPLIIWFPNQEYVGKTNKNIQLIDIAPTILDYLDVTKSTWMTGDSILADDLSPNRYIFSTDIAHDLVSLLAGKGWVVDQTKVSPPFYQLGASNLVVCKQWFSLNLRNPKLTYGHVKGSTAECDETDIPSPEKAKEILLQRLREDGYDTSSYPTEIQIQPVEIP